MGLSVILATRLPASWWYLALVAAAAPFVLMAVGSVRRALLTIIVLDAPLQLGFHLGYREDVGKLGSIGGLGISATTVALVVLYGLWFAQVLVERRSVLWPALRANPFLVLYVSAVVLSLGVAHDVQLSAFEAFMVVQSLLMFVYVASTTRTRQDVLFLVTVLMVALVLEGLIMLVTQAVGRDLSFAGIHSVIDARSGMTGRFYRIGGTLGSPNVAAAYLAMLIPLAVAILMSGSREAPRVLAVIGVALGVMALFFTFSRGGWLAFGIATVVLSFSSWRRGWLPPYVPIGIILVAVVLPLVFQNAVLSRVTDSEAALGRVPLVYIALRMFESSPVLGIGANNYAASMNLFMSPDIANAWLYTVHNKYLLVLAETGLLGLLAFLLFLTTTLYAGLSSLAARRSIDSPDIDSSHRGDCRPHGAHARRYLQRADHGADAVVRSGPSRRDWSSGRAIPRDCQIRRLIPARKVVIRISAIGR